MAQIPKGITAKVINTIENKYQPGYSVVEVMPDKGQKEKIYQFAGSRSGVAHQISQFMATREYIEDKFLEPDFDAFAENFEYCFPTALGKSANGNNLNPWGKPAENRPKFKKMTLPDRGVAARYL